MNESEKERIAIIMESCKVSEAEAIAIYKHQLAEELWAEKIEKMKRQQLLQKMRRHKPEFDGKRKGGNDE